MDDCDGNDWYSGGTAVLYLMYITVFCVALVGNLLVIYVVLASPPMRTTTNYWLVNLAVGDGLVTMACIPFSFVSTFRLQYWPFGPWMCPLVNFSQLPNNPQPPNRHSLTERPSQTKPVTALFPINNRSPQPVSRATDQLRKILRTAVLLFTALAEAVSVLVSAYTLVAISADRYLAIIRPLRPRLSSGQVFVVLVAVWAFAALTALPILLRSALSQPSDQFEKCGRYICTEEWGQGRNKYLYSMILMVLQYVLPLLVLLYTYTRIAFIVWGKRTPGEANNTRDRRRAIAKRKMIKMMVIVVLIFTICWLPFNALQLVLDNDEEANKWAALPYVYLACHWLAMSHSCANPLIYCWMNSRFRQAFRAVLARFSCARYLLPRSALMTRANTLTTFVSLRQSKSGRSATQSPPSATPLISSAVAPNETLI